jgi:Arc/MetJ-type ribon-helix-helix transcriptional regulator
MGPADSKSYQLRVRVTEEERDFLEKLRTERNRGETISDLVREAISLLAKNDAAGKTSALNASTQAKIERLAALLKREPQQVEEACIDGIVDMIESKCEVPLIVMETHLHLKYRNKDEKIEFSRTPPTESPSSESAQPPHG